jgi:DNA repair protein RecN (Recombination protein N)
MLTRIYIKNIVLISELNLDLPNNFTAITGQTGAGKSIIIDSINLALGGRLDTSLIRNSEDRGEVICEFLPTKEAVAILKEQEIEVLDSIILRRVIHKDGKSKAFINSTPVSLATIRQITDSLIIITTQHSQISLLEATRQLELIDSYGEIESGSLKTLHQAYKILADKLSQMQEDSAKAKQDSDYLSYVAKELSDADIKEGEELTLIDARILAKNSGEIKQAAKTILDTLAGASLVKADKAIAKLPDNISARIASLITEASSSMLEAGSLVTDYLAEIDNNIDFASLEDRLHFIRNLTKKYGRTNDELPKYLEEIRAKLELASDDSGQMKALEKEVAATLDTYNKEAEKISAKRQKAAKALETKLSSELEELELKGCKIKIEFNKKPPSSSGIDELAILAQINSGTNFAAISKIASGGELSRIMLAFLIVLSNKSAAKAIIFDEIDTGISGKAASLVGKKLRELGATMQVLAITHQPQVAALANHHLQIAKVVKSGATFSNITYLDEAMRVDEIAGMLSAESITDESRNAAKALILGK